MAIIKDVTVKINNGTATLDTPVQFYEKDHDVELRFKLMDYKYKYDKDPQNILNSVDEDILEAYTTIVNPRGHELEQINGVVKNDTVIFRLDPTYTDELDEVGTYNLQIHIKCTCSEFTIPPITFEVLERLKGIKVVTDGEDEVDNSEILDNSSKFVSDETGKLIIEWKKGDMISSAKLNAMVDVINDAVDEEAIRQANEIERQEKVNNKIQELEDTRVEYINKIDTELDSFADQVDASMTDYEEKVNNKIQELEDTRVEYINKIDTELDSFADQVDASMTDYETRFNALTSSQQQDAEVIDARDGEVSLKARLDRDIEKAKEIYVDAEGTYISTDSSSGYAKDVEILGNTIQDASNLADIRSVGDKVEGQELYKIDVVSSGKNIWKPSDYDLDSSWIDGTYMSKWVKLKPNTNYVITCILKKIPAGRCILLVSNNVWENPDRVELCNVFNYSQSNGVLGKVKSSTFTTPSNGMICLQYYESGHNIDKVDLTQWINEICDIQLEEGTVATPYEPYQEDKLTILSPVQLEKVGDVADRIICKDGVWGVEKNVETVVINGDLIFYNYMTASTLYTSASVSTYPIKEYLCISSIGCKTSAPNEEVEGVFTHKSGAIYFSISKSKVANFEELKSWVSKNPITVKYITTQPQFIPLPHDQQVKLRTFANKTNISFLTEIQGSIKAQIPKSIGAAINTHTEQINNLNKELDRVKKLEESTVSTVTTESGFTTVEETSNGYFEDVKLEGKTLVNLSTIKDCSITKDNKTSGYYNTNADFAIKPSTIYTLICDVDVSNSTNRDALSTTDYSSSVFETAVLAGGVFNSGKYSILVRSKSDLTGKNRFGFKIGALTGTVNISNLMILEGDHTQNPPSYFEGLMSVGDGVDEISVESVKGDGNLFDGELEIGSYDSRGNEAGNNDALRNKNRFIRVVKDTLYLSTELYIHQYDINKKFIKYEQVYGKIKLDPECKYINFRTTNIDTVDIGIYYTEECSADYSKPDKKPLLYYNPTTQTWEKPILRQWDSIEKHSDGKYYYHKRSGEVVLNGSEGWTLSSIGTNVTVFILKLSNKGQLLSNKFQIGDILGANCLGSLDENHIFIKLQKELLTTQDVEGFKAWLQANPTTVVYQLAQEEVYECTNIDLITYENETNYIVNAGAITPKSTLKVMSNIGNVVCALQQKVSNLENYIQHVMIDALNNALDE